MAFSASDSSLEPRSFSIGNLKLQILTYSAASGDTSGTVTADKLSSIMHVYVDGGLKFAAAPSLSGNVATLSFANPAANIYGTILCVGV